MSLVERQIAKVVNEAKAQVEDVQQSLVASGKGLLGVNSNDTGERLNIRWYFRVRVRRKGRAAVTDKWVPVSKRTKRVSTRSVIGKVTRAEFDIFADAEPMFRRHRIEVEGLRRIDKRMGGRGVPVWGEEADSGPHMAYRSAVYDALRQRLRRMTTEAGENARKIVREVRVQLAQEDGYLGLDYRDTQTGFSIRWYRVKKIYQAPDDGTRKHSAYVRKGHGVRQKLGKLEAVCTEAERRIFEEAEDRLEVARTTMRAVGKSLIELNVLEKKLAMPEFIDADTEWLKYNEQKSRIKSLKK